MQTGENGSCFKHEKKEKRDLVCEQPVRRETVNDGERGFKLKRCRYCPKGNSENVPALYAFQTQSSQTVRENRALLLIHTRKPDQY